MVAVHERDQLLRGGIGDTAGGTIAAGGIKMIRSMKSGVVAMAVLASTFAGGLTQPAQAQGFFNPYGYNTNLVNPYYGGDVYRRPSVLKPTLIGAAIGGAGGLGVSLLSGRDKHYVRNVGIGAGIGAAAGAGVGLIKRHNFNRNLNYGFY